MRLKHIEESLYSLDSYFSCFLICFTNDEILGDHGLSQPFLTGMDEVEARRAVSME